MKQIITILLLFSTTMAFSQFRSVSLDTATVNFRTTTGNDTIVAGKRYINIENAGAADIIVNTDTIRTGKAGITLYGFYDWRTRTYFRLPQFTINATGSEAKITTID